MNNDDRYSMKDFKPLPLKEKQLRLEEAIVKLQNDKSDLVMSMKRIDTKLSASRGEINSRGYMPKEEYATICKEQSLLKQEKYDIENKIQETNKLLKEKNAEKDRLRYDMSRLPIEKAKEILLESRDKYMAFGADTTRVSSMRAMASKFVEELTLVLKYFEE